MPFVLALLGALGAVYFFVIRARNARDMASEVLDVANDVRLAARRFGFRRQTHVHPVDAIEDSNIAVAALGSAFVELDDLPTREQRAALGRAVARMGGIAHSEAEEMLVLGRWIVNESGGPAQSVSRLAKRLYKMTGADGFAPLMEVIKAVGEAGQGGLSAGQKDALSDVQRAFRIA